jgi:restriction system protein
MANSRKNNWRDRDYARLFLLAVLTLAFLFYKYPKEVYFYSALCGVLMVVGFILISEFKKRYTNNLLKKIKEFGQEEYLRNFINRFGLEGGKKGGFSFRGHNFDWDRINDLKRIFREKKVISNEKDIFILLRHFIQEKEEGITRESIKKEVQKFSYLSGSDFEKLLNRLFEMMGYKVELIGRSGDQGGDLIANKDGERILIQAKCYRDWSTGNVAVQQVVGAIKFYDCGSAMVVTTSHFTREAISLAKANNVELISKEQLQELLLKYLGESWI